METATVTVEGDRQTVRLPKSVHLPATVFVRQDGDAVVLEPAKERQKVERFISTIIELSLDRAAAEKAAQLRADLERQGQPIGPYDLLIAGRQANARPSRQQSFTYERCGGEHAQTSRRIYCSGRHIAAIPRCC